MGGGGGQGGRRPRPELQERIVAAVLELLAELTPADLVGSLGTRAIAARAGVSQASIFHQFGSVAGLARAVVAQVFHPAAVPLEQITAGLEAIKGAGLPVEAGDAYHRSEFARLTNDPGLRLRMGLWALGGGESDAAYRDFLRATDTLIAVFAEPLWSHWAREPRPPFTTASIVAAQVALLNGLAIRHLVDPEVSTPEHHSLVSSALTFVTLRPPGDHHDVADKLAEINYYPLRNSRSGRPLEGRAAITGAALMTAAAELFGSRGYEETTVAQIARRARVSASTLYRSFGSKAGLAAALFSKQVEDMLVHDPTFRAATPEDAWVAHLMAVAGFVATHTEHAPAYLTSILTGPPEVHVEDLLITTTLDRLLAVPARRSGVDPHETALATIGLLIGRVLARPAVPAAEHVGAVTAMVGVPISGGSD